MKVNVNMSAVLANKQLLRTENKLGASMQRLSSGFKINSAGDNPAGMAISNKMRAQIDALDQATDNSSNAISTLQIADGALNEVSDILQRMRELSVQAANGTNSYSDRQAMQDEINQLRKEVDRISANTEYNTKTLLDGSSDVRVYADQKVAERIRVSDSVGTGFYRVQVDAPSTQASLELGNFTDIAVDGTFSINGKSITVSVGETKNEFYNDLSSIVAEAGCVIDADEYAKGTIAIKSMDYGKDGEISFSCTKNLAQALGIADKGNQNADGDSITGLLRGKDAEVSFPNDDAKAAGYSSTATVTADGNHITIKDQNGFSLDFLLDSDYAGGELEFEVTDIGSMTIQVGGNQYQTLEVRIPEVSANSLYLDTIDVTVKGGAEKAMVTLDEAISELNSVRSRIGAYQNRLEYSSSSLAETTENMTSAYSTILDTDMAAEMTEFTKLNVLQQAATSVLSQANDLPQQVLSLLQ